MAKKAVADLSNAGVGDIEKGLIKKFGEGIIRSADDFFSKPKMVIPFSPAIDFAIGGGVREGCWLTMSGPAKCGKTSALIHLARQCQKPEYGGRTIYYFNIEGRLNERDVRLSGLDSSKFKIISSTQGNIIVGEQWLDIIESLVRGVPGMMGIIDSVSALSPEKEATSGIGAARGETTRLVSQLCRKLANVVPVNNTILCAVRHLIANTSGYGATFQEDGGNKISYQVDYWIQAKNGKPRKVEEDGKFVGQETDWELKCSPLGPPVEKFTTVQRYGGGLDEAAEIVLIGKELGFVEQKGAWFYVDDYSLEPDLRNETNKLKFQGEANMRDYLANNPEIMKKIQTQMELLYK